MASPFDAVTGAPLPALVPGSFDLVVLRHSLHYGVPCWAEWGAGVARLAAPGARAFVVFIDPGLLPPGAFTLPDGSSVGLRAPAGQGAPPGACSARVSLAWSASGLAPRTETFVGRGAVVALFERNGWALESEETDAPVEKAGDAPAVPWDAWARAERRLVFARKP